MDGKTAVIQQHPSAVPVALPVKGRFAGLLLQGLFHGAAQGVDLGVGCAGGDDKVVCQGGEVCDLDGGDLLAFFFIQGLYRGDCQFLRCHGAVLSFFHS